MSSLIRIDKFENENSRTQTTINKFFRHSKRCSAGSTQCPNFSTTSEKDLSHQIAEKHIAPKPVVTFKREVCYQGFPDFYALH